MNAAVMTRVTMWEGVPYWRSQPSKAKAGNLLGWGISFASANGNRAGVWYSHCVHRVTGRVTLACWSSTDKTRAGDYHVSAPDKGSDATFWELT